MQELKIEVWFEESAPAETAYTAVVVDKDGPSADLVGFGATHAGAIAALAREIEE